MVSVPLDTASAEAARAMYDESVRFLFRLNADVMGEDQVSIGDYTGEIPFAGVLLKKDKDLRTLAANRR